MNLNLNESEILSLIAIADIDKSGTIRYLFML